MNEAINEIQSRIDCAEKYYPDEVPEYVESLRKAVESMKKQVPLRPIRDRMQEIRYTSSYSCPTCKGGFTGTGIAKYCYHCGQALDWGRDDVER